MRRGASGDVGGSRERARRVAQPFAGIVLPISSQPQSADVANIAEPNYAELSTFGLFYMFWALGVARVGSRGIKRQ